MQLVGKVKPFSLSRLEEAVDQSLGEGGALSQRAPVRPPVKPTTVPIQSAKRSRATPRPAMPWRDWGGDLFDRYGGDDSPMDRYEIAGCREIPSPASSGWRMSTT